jgi:hypothetical protein
VTLSISRTGATLRSESLRDTWSCSCPCRLWDWTPNPAGRGPTALRILEPASGSSFARSPVTVRGEAPSGARIVRDVSFGRDQVVTADSAGSWSMDVELREGPHELVFRLGDDKATEQRVSVAVGSGDVAPTRPHTTRSPQAGRPGRVTAAEFGDAWTLTVSAGTMICDNSAVLFRADDGGLYAVNGMAITRHPDLPEIDEIWADHPDPYIPKKDIGPLIRAGLALC